MAMTDLGDYSLTLTPAAEVLADASLLQQWQALVEGMSAPNLLYVSPTWFEHVSQSAGPSELLLAVVRDKGGRLVGACPARVQPHTLTYDLSNRVLMTTRLRAVWLSGCEVMVPSAPGAYERFFRGVLDAVGSCDCVYLNTIPAQGPLFEALRQGRLSSVLPYLPFGTRPWHSIEMKGDFEAFLGTKGGKTRSTLRRKVRQLRDHGGSLELRCVTREEQVESFLGPAAQVSEKTWQHDLLGLRVEQTPAYAEKLKDLARRGLLRAYLLEGAGQPYAYLIGYQYKETYYYEETGFDQSLGDLSPGTALLYMVLEDLFRSSPPEVFDFGIGDGVHKRRFANRECADTAAILFRRTLRNRLRLASHNAFQGAVRFAKWALGRKVTKG